MKGLYELAIFLTVLTVWTVTEFLCRHAQAVLFIAGFAALTIGFALAWLPLGFIVPGAIVCGLLVWDSTVPVRRLSEQKREGEDA